MQSRIGFWYIKDGQHYHFGSGYLETGKLIDRVMEMVEDSKYDLDWLDAANISHAITERVARGDIDMSGLSEIAFEDNLEGDLGEDSELDSDEDSTEV